MVLHFAAKSCIIYVARNIMQGGYSNVGKYAQEFPAYYTALCARVADAIDALEQQNYGAAKDALISGMQEAEEIILAQEDGSPAK